MARAILWAQASGQSTRHPLPGWSSRHAGACNRPCPLAMDRPRPQSSMQHGHLCAGLRRGRVYACMGTGVQHD
eukprot:202408-Chlamydomonas_euryale.AAC.2